jgi:hypothetical protein
MAYENIYNWTLGENKPNSNPIKANFRNAKMNENLFAAKVYENETAFRLPKYKPKQSQFLYHWLRLLFIIAAENLIRNFVYEYDWCGLSEVY